MFEINETRNVISAENAINIFKNTLAINNDQYGNKADTTKTRGPGALTFVNSIAKNQL